MGRRGGARGERGYFVLFFYQYPDFIFLSRKGRVQKSSCASLVIVVFSHSQRAHKAGGWTRGETGKPDVWACRAPLSRRCAQALRSGACPRSSAGAPRPRSAIPSLDQCSEFVEAPDSDAYEDNQRYVMKGCKIHVQKQQKGDEAKTLTGARALQLGNKNNDLEQRASVRLGKRAKPRGIVRFAGIGVVDRTHMLSYRQGQTWQPTRLALAANPIGMLAFDSPLNPRAATNIKRETREWAPRTTSETRSEQQEDNMRRGRGGLGRYL